LIRPRVSLLTKFNFYRKQKVKAVYGSWVKELYAVDPGQFDEFMKEINSGTSPSHNAKVSESLMTS
jgi:hypothetical protein